MLIRKTYHLEKRKEIKQLILDVIKHLQTMSKYFDEYLIKPKQKTRDFIIKNERHVNKYEKRVEEFILEYFSLDQLNLTEIKWLLAINRIIRELERTGDYLINIITFSKVTDFDVLRPVITDFFIYVDDMICWLYMGIESDDIALLEKVINHDRYVNKLNKEYYEDVTNLLEQNTLLSESDLKSILISRFLERIGDHLVNAAKVYKKVIVVDG